MPGFRVIPIPRNISEQARTELRAPKYGHPAHSEPAAGYGPCRSCLRQFRVGEDRRLLFTYDPFAGIDVYPCPGPIFIHEESCEPFDTDSAFPTELRALPLTLEGYGRDRWLIARERPAEHEIETAIDRIFRNRAVEYIHLRNTEAGCFIAQIARSENAGAHREGEEPRC